MTQNEAESCTPDLYGDDEWAKDGVDENEGRYGNED